MEYKCVWTNDLSGDKSAQGKALTILNAGDAVRIGSTCIGHTRAAMVEEQGEKFLRDNGAHDVGCDPRFPWMGHFFAL